MDSLTLTVSDIATAVDPQRIIVVDNSEDAAIFEQIARQLPAEVNAIRTANRGYAHAVNLGVQWLHNQNFLSPSSAVLVSTHEVRFRPDAILALAEVLADSGRVAAVGPVTTVLNEDGREEVWSSGGGLTRFTRLPFHRDHGRDLEKVVGSDRGQVPARWLDGAAVLYRGEVLLEQPLLEGFFLYVEELELHTRLLLQGHEVCVALNAVAQQSTSGAPPFLEARNIQYFQALHGTPLSRIVAVPFNIAKLTARVLLGRERWKSIPIAVGGWMVGITTMRAWRQNALRELADSSILSPR